MRQKADHREQKRGSRGEWAEDGGQREQIRETAEESGQTKRGRGEIVAHIDSKFNKKCADIKRNYTELSQELPKWSQKAPKGKQNAPTREQNYLTGVQHVIKTSTREKGRLQDDLPQKGYSSQIALLAESVALRSILEVGTSFH